MRTYREYARRVLVWTVTVGGFLAVPTVRGQEYTLEFATISSGGGITDNESVLIVGQAVVGTATSEQFPYNTISEAVEVVVWDGEIRIASGSYPERVTIHRRMRLTARGGLVRIGR